MNWYYFIKTSKSILLNKGINIDLYNKSFQSICSKLELNIKHLGDIDGYPILLSHPKKLKPNNKNMLIVSGFHGEEIAGPLAILKFLNKLNKKRLENINLSIIPMLNPWGLKHHIRNNKDGLKTNLLFDTEKSIYTPSDIGQLLKRNRSLIKELGKTVIVDLHENVESDSFYLYIYNRLNEGYEITENKDLLEIVLQSGKRHFPVRPDGTYQDSFAKRDIYEIKNGVVNNFYDGSFDDYASRILKCPLVIVNETPGKDELPKRLEAQSDMIRSIFYYLCRDSDKPKVLIPVPVVKQTTSNSCGGSALHSILSYYGIEETEKKINELANISDEGIEVDDIINVCHKFGLKAKVIYECSFKELRSYLDKKIPVIVAIVAWGNDKKDYAKNKDGHYVIAIGYDKNRFYFEDPSMRNTKGFLDNHEFLSRWHDIDGKGIAIPVVGRKGKIEDFKEVKFVRIP